MMRKARLAIRKVNVALDSPGYYFGTGRSLIPSSHLFVSARISSKRERSSHSLHCRRPPLARRSQAKEASRPCPVRRNRSRSEEQVASCFRVICRFANNWKVCAVICKISAVFPKALASVRKVSALLRRRSALLRKRSAVLWARSEVSRRRSALLRRRFEVLIEAFAVIRRDRVILCKR